MLIRPSTVLLLLLFPIFDLYVLIKVGGQIGASVAVFLVIFTSVLGYFLFKYQGVNTMAGVKKSLLNGELPAKPLFEGALIMFGAFLLLLPGFITDTVGLLILVPWFRNIIWRKLSSKFQMQAGFHRSNEFSSGNTYESENSEERDASQPRILEGEYKRDD